MDSAKLGLVHPLEKYVDTFILILCAVCFAILPSIVLLFSSEFDCLQRVERDMSEAIWILKFNLLLSKSSYQVGLLSPQHGASLGCG
jgi:hypothetical protein